MEDAKKALEPTYNALGKTEKALDTLRKTQAEALTAQKVAEDQAQMLRREP